MDVQWRPSAWCAFRHLAGDRGSPELQSAASAPASRIPASLRGTVESRLPVSLPEKQYRITKAQVRRFQDALADLAGRKRPSNISPRLWVAQRQAAQSQMEELQ